MTVSWAGLIDYPNGLEILVHGLEGADVVHWQDHRPVLAVLLLVDVQLEHAVGGFRDPDGPVFVLPLVIEASQD
jgi:hypothetical protein